MQISLRRTQQYIFPGGRRHSHLCAPSCLPLKIFRQKVGLKVTNLAEKDNNLQVILSLQKIVSTYFNQKYFYVLLLLLNAKEANFG